MEKDVSREMMRLNSKLNGMVSIWNGERRDYFPSIFIIIILRKILFFLIDWMIGLMDSNE